jgi:hypothetical protein
MRRLHEPLDSVEYAQGKCEVVIEFDGADVRLSLSQDAFGSFEKGSPVLWVFVWEIQG